MTEVVKKLSPLLVFHPISGPPIFHLSDDLLLKILFTVDGDGDRATGPASPPSSPASPPPSSPPATPHKCRRSIPTAVADLLPPYPPPPPRWLSSLHKVAVFCVGLLHAGVLLDHSDFEVLVIRL